MACMTMEIRIVVWRDGGTGAASVVATPERAYGDKYCALLLRFFSYAFQHRLSSFSGSVLDRGGREERRSMRSVDDTGAWPRRQSVTLADSPLARRKKED